MGTAITQMVSSPTSLVLLAAVVMIVAPLGPLYVIIKGSVRELIKVTWKNKLFGELTLIYHAKESAEKAEDEPGGEVDKAIH